MSLLRLHSVSATSPVPLECNTTMSDCNLILIGAAMADCALPGDTMIEILSTLPVKSLMRFRCVCKPWYSLITSPSFVTKHLTQTTHNTNENLIIRSKGLEADNFKILFYMLLQGKRTFDGSINLEIPFEESSNFAKIVGSCNGLLCYVNQILGIFLWNPATREYRMLPQAGFSTFMFSLRSSFIGFGFDANANDYKLVQLLCFKGLKPPVYKAEVYSKKADSWKVVNADLQCLLSESSSSAVFSGGVHWIAGDSDNSELIAYFDLGREVFGEIQLPDFCRYGIGMGRELAVVKDLLAVVHPLQNRCIDVWVMKEYGVEESWTKLFSMGPFSIVLRPIAFFRNGGFVLKNNKNKLFLYDSNTGGFNELPARRARHIYDICTCMETLVSVEKGE